MSYLDTVHEFYKDKALNPGRDRRYAEGRAFSSLPELHIPEIMQVMDYGCGTTVHCGEIKAGERILYVGVGGGLEPFLFSYFTRRPRAVLAVDRVPEMLAKAQENLRLAAEVNPWFQPEFIELRLGDALSLPVETASVEVAAQNGLFNIFTQDDLALALGEMHRVLKPGGRLYIADPITTQALPSCLCQNDALRARCIAGALTLEAYLEKIGGAGFGRIEIRSVKPYRVLEKDRYSLAQDIVLQAVELAAYKTPVPPDGASVFRGETLLYFGTKELLDSGEGHVLWRNIPLPVSQKTADEFRKNPREGVTVTEPTFHYGSR